MSIVSIYRTRVMYPRPRLPLHQTSMCWTNYQPVRRSCSNYWKNWTARISTLLSNKWKRRR